jgi:5'-nucleotidase
VPDVDPGSARGVPGVPDASEASAGPGGSGPSEDPPGGTGAPAGAEEFILAVDLDGVCADHAEGFAQVVAAERGIDRDELGPQVTWNYHEWGLTDEDFDRLHRRAVLEHRMFATMPTVAGAAETLWRLSDSGVWIRIVTHRLYANWGHAVTVGDTVAWLDRVGIPYRDLCFLGTKPAVQADLYVEDAPHNLAELAASGAEVIIFDQPYNRDVPGRRARDWTEVETAVTEARVAQGQAVQEVLALPSPAVERLKAGGHRPME